ncbi:ATP-binding protein [Magnetococcus sp. PR-3]|uniref:ATP-binding protein n=1 Tax=Magnetococcus sp. PR-3 TaxID=3120355 RepID=UPI002FCE136F
MKILASRPPFQILRAIFLVLLGLLTLPPITIAATPQTLVVATSEAWPPFSFTDEDGTLKGLVVDFWKAYGVHTGKNIRFRPSHWKGTLEGIKSGDAHIHSGLFYSDHRDTFLDFSEDLAIPLASRLFLSSQLKATGFSDLGLEPVAVTKAGFAATFLSQHHPAIQLHPYPNSKQTMEAAVKGDIKAFVTDYPAAMYYLHKLGKPEQFRVVDTLYTKYLKAAVAQGNQTLLDEINLNLKSFPPSEWQRIVQKWISIEPIGITPPWLYPTVLGLMLILVLSGVAIHTRTLRKQVYNRTQDLEQQITERRQLEVNLRNSEKSYRELFDSMDDAIYIHNATGHFIAVNQAVEKLFGLPKETFVNKTPHDFRAANLNDMSSIEHAWNQCLQGFQPRFEYWGVNNQGIPFPQEIQLSSGVYMGQSVIIGVGRDITQRKKMEERLRESELRLRTAGKASYDLIYEWNVDSDELLWFGDIDHFLGFSAGEISRDIQAWLALIHPDDAPTLADAVIHHRESIEPIRFDYRIRRKDGSYRYWSDHGLPLLDDQGKPYRWIGVCTDITERQEMEIALRESRDRAQQANQAKSEFLAAMSHEIRTPMNVVIGLSDLLMETTQDPEQKGYLDRLQHAGQTLMELINNILDLSKVEAGQLNIDHSPYPLQTIVHKSVELFRISAQEKGVELNLTLDPTLPEMIMGDAGRLQQILLNLLSNALKFTDQGAVLVEAQRLGDGELEISVIDSGIGIDPKELPRIFEKFTQVDGSLTRRHGGTGLGLAISRQLVALMGGTLLAYNNQVQGCTFRINLPCIESDARPKAEEDTINLQACTQSYRILMVEDSPDNQILIRAYLKQSHHHLEMANNGQEGVLKAQKQTFDLILMDMQMPVMDGYRATQVIRQHEATHGIKPVPIVALTAHALADERDKTLAAGCNGFLTKPIKRDQLLKAIVQYAHTQSNEELAAMT